MADPVKPDSPRIDLTNHFLVAMPGMADETFERTVVYLCEHTEKGALGLVINKPIDIKLKNLFEKVELKLDHRRELAEQPVYFGGPVQTERGFVLHDGAGAGLRSSGRCGHLSFAVRLTGRRLELQLPGGRFASQSDT